ncbi:MAG: hypothetical protein ACQEWV_12330 [Bacillota bacterium]
MASGIGRIGGMLGPLLGGFLLSVTLPIHLNFIAFAIPGLIAALALALVPDRHAHYNKVSNEGDANLEPNTTNVS